MAAARDPELRQRVALAPEKMRRSARRRSLSVVLLAVGVALLGYVASQYWYMHHTQGLLETEWERQATGPHATADGLPVLTRISIPKIDLDAIVLEGASSRQLSLGPGHLTDTAVPGDTGNAVITGHRDTFFRRIFELDEGDEIRVERSGHLFRYQVTGKKVVKPDDMSVIRPTSDAELTLITCYPIHYIGPAPKRLVILSRLVATDSSNPAARLLQ